MTQQTSSDSLRPDIYDANLLYLISLLLLVTIGLAVQSWSPLWGLIITEIVVILVPALIYLCVRRLPFGHTLRLRWPGWRLAILSVALGAGTYVVSVVFEGMMTTLLGYTPPVSPQSLPDTSARAVLYVIGLAVFAPICEEVLFRGMIQRGYLRKGAWVSILVGGLLFAFYHLRFKGLMPLLPVALILGYVFWRSDSLVPAVLVHFANNALASAVTVVSVQRPDAIPWQVFGVGALAALPVIGAGLWLFNHWAGRPATTPEAATVGRPSVRLIHAWPLLLAAPIYLFMAGYELVQGRFPELLAIQPLDLRPAPWQEEIRLSYALHNAVSGEPQGEASCWIRPEEDSVILECALHQTAYEVKQGRSVWYGADVVQEQSFRWESATMGLLAGEVHAQVAGSAHVVMLTENDDNTLTVSVDNMAHDALLAPVDLLLVAGGPGSVLSTTEWVWRLSALPFEAGYAARATAVNPYVWNAELGRPIPALVQMSVMVRETEHVTVPAGEFTAWQVRLGGEFVAWYDIEPPYSLVRYEDGILIWELVSLE